MTWNSLVFVLKKTKQNRWMLILGGKGKGSSQFEGGRKGFCLVFVSLRNLFDSYLDIRGSVGNYVNCWYITVPWAVLSYWSDEVNTNITPIKRVRTRELEVQCQSQVVTSRERFEPQMSDQRTLTILYNWKQTLLVRWMQILCSLVYIHLVGWWVVEELFKKRNTNLQLQTR